MVTSRVVRSLVFCLAACVPLVGIAGSEMFDLDPALGARVAREKAKARGEAGAKREGVSADKTVVSGQDDCGVNIGNVESSKSGIGRPIRENTVVITGPVINLGKCKEKGR